MKRLNKKTNRVGLGLLCTLPLWLAGCGGGGPDTSGLTPVSGTLQLASGAHLSGYRVVYDPNTTAGTIASTSDAKGQFSFFVTQSQVTGNDTVYVYDTTGSLAAIATIVPGAAPGTITITPLAPPPPPV